MMEVLGFHVISMVWAGHPVGFDLLTHGDQQFVAFYDADRHMTVGMSPPPASLPSELLELRSDFPDMEVRTRMARGANPDTGVRYLLRWETLPRNRDKAWENVPPPGELRLYTLQVE